MPITINGSGTVTGIVAGGLPDAIITQPELAAGVAGTGPAFSAYLSANQTAPSLGVWTKVAFDAELFDTNSNFTSGKFTPTVAGYYQVNATVQFAAGSTSLCSVAIYKNGSVTSQGTTFTPSTVYAFSHSALIYMNGSTDYLELYAYVSNTTQIGSGAGITQFNGSLVRAA